MAHKKSSLTKRDALRQQGVFNARSENVTDPLFQEHEFFDPEDLVQVKYEMLRRVENDHQPVLHAAAAFGFSRPTFYQAQQDFEQRGLAGLIRDKPGPRRAHKATAKVLEFVARQRAQDPSITSAEAARQVKQRFGVKIHPRSIERAIRSEQKKPR